jgi:DNA-binding transcriptional ArsR family regulator
MSPPSPRRNPPGRPKRTSAPPLLDAVCSALAHPGRRRILQILSQNRSMSTRSLCERFPNVGRTAVTAHLHILRRAGLVTLRTGLGGSRDWHYRLAPDGVNCLREWISVYFDRYAAMADDQQASEAIARLLSAAL